LVLNVPLNVVTATSSSLLAPALTLLTPPLSVLVTQLWSTVSLLPRTQTVDLKINLLTAKAHLLDFTTALVELLTLPIPSTNVLLDIAPILLLASLTSLKDKPVLMTTNVEVTLLFSELNTLAKLENAKRSSDSPLETLALTTTTVSYTLLTTSDVSTESAPLKRSETIALNSADLISIVMTTILVKTPSLLVENAVQTLLNLDVLLTEFVTMVSVLLLNLRTLVTLVPILLNANTLLIALERL